MRSAVVGLPLRRGSAAAGFFRGRRRAIGFGFGAACFVGDRAAPTIVPRGMRAGAGAATGAFAARARLQALWHFALQASLVLLLRAESYHLT